MVAKLEFESMQNSAQYMLGFAVERRCMVNWKPDSYVFGKRR